MEKTLKSWAGLELVRVSSLGGRQQGGRMRLALRESGLKHLDTMCLSCIGRRRRFTVEFVCNQSLNMSEEEGLSLDVRVFMIKKGGVMA